MTDLPDPVSREQLLEAFSRDWNALMSVIEGVTTEMLIERTDAAGWNTRDHLAHLDAWLNSVIVMIRDGAEQWTGTGAPRELFSHDDYDPLNEAIRQNTIDWPIDTVLAQLRDRHETMVGILTDMTDEDLLKPVDDFVANGGDFAICYKIDGNGPHHYREHAEYIRRILG